MPNLDPPGFNRSNLDIKETVSSFKRFMRDLIKVSISRDGIEECWVFAVVSSDRTEGKEYNVKHRMFPLNFGEHFFTVRVLNSGKSYPESCGVCILGGIPKPSEQLWALWLWAACSRCGDPAGAGSWSN